MDHRNLFSSKKLNENLSIILSILPMLMNFVFSARKPVAATVICKEKAVQNMQYLDKSFG